MQIWKTWHINAYLTPNYKPKLSNWLKTTLYFFAISKFIYEGGVLVQTEPRKMVCNMASEPQENFLCIEM